MTAQSENDAQTVAAVDLGSNSFHMIVSRREDGEVLKVDRLKEMVRLASGLDPEGRLDPEVAQRALDCLDRFGQRLRQLPRGHVRVVGTNTLRQMHDSRGFLHAAEEALGHPVEIIAGREEARLIYLGVAHTLADDSGRRLVMDIGGGSTEFIIGERFEPILAESLEMGCVTFTRRFFADGKLSRKAFAAAQLRAEQELQPIASAYRQQGWDQALGASGTILALDSMVHEARLEEAPGIGRESLEALRDGLIEHGTVEGLKFPGLAEDRAPVIAGGLAVLLGAFEALGIERLHPSDGALREGVVHDLLGRFRHEDVRGQTIHNLRRRFAVDAAQAERVQATVARLVTAVRAAWGLDEEDAERLEWAAELHEIGLALAHSKYHKHGEYILAWADLPGFSQPEQAELALLVRMHRRSFKPKLLSGVHEGRSGSLLCMASLLRLGVLLHRSRSPDPVPLERIEATAEGLTLAFASGWLDAHPLTRADLEAEREEWVRHERVLEFQ
ncbi:MULTISPECIES: Ppx/GppA phosphatase family protein [unclassified Thioalkalivibrio]|uniref:Ppx/GppA phosphatase family protein n=1 Tax=unclassified Thioalkalivibrio TaxID=2621013 RepID=UPI00037EEACF|nr:MULTISPECIES: Ppx/GppA phosphatase family protein [unclassified Thioalkalivibrio]